MQQLNLELTEPEGTKKNESLDAILMFKPEGPSGFIIDGKEYTLREGLYIANCLNQAFSFPEVKKATKNENNNNSRR